MSMEFLQNLLESDPETAAVLRELRKPKPPDRSSTTEGYLETYERLCDLVDGWSESKLKQHDEMLDAIQFAFQDEAAILDRKLKRSDPNKRSEISELIEWARKMNGIW